MGESYRWPAAVSVAERGRNEFKVSSASSGFDLCPRSARVHSCRLPLPLPTSIDALFSVLTLSIGSPLVLATDLLLLDVLNAIDGSLDDVVEHTSLHCFSSDGLFPLRC
jgi:hypothetical protein